jgi:hypothetical protein
VDRCGRARRGCRGFGGCGGGAGPGAGVAGVAGVGGASQLVGLWLGFLALDDGGGVVPPPWRLPLGSGARHGCLVLGAVVWVGVSRVHGGSPIPGGSGAPNGAWSVARCRSRPNSGSRCTSRTLNSGFPNRDVHLARLNPGSGLFSGPIPCEMYISIRSGRVKRARCTSRIGTRDHTTVPSTSWAPNGTEYVARCRSWRNSGSKRLMSSGSPCEAGWLSGWWAGRWRARSFTQLAADGLARGFGAPHAATLHGRGCPQSGGPAGPRHRPDPRPGQPRTPAGANDTTTMATGQHRRHRPKPRKPTQDQSAPPT